MRETLAAAIRPPVAAVRIDPRRPRCWTSRWRPLPQPAGQVRRAVGVRTDSSTGAAPGRSSTPRAVAGSRTRSWPATPRPARRRAAHGRRRRRAAGLRAGAGGRHVAPGGAHVRALGAGVDAATLRELAAWKGMRPSASERVRRLRRSEHQLPAPDAHGHADRALVVEPGGEPMTGLLQDPAARRPVERRGARRPGHLRRLQALEARRRRRWRSRGSAGPDDRVARHHDAGLDRRGDLAHDHVVGRAVHEERAERRVARALLAHLGRELRQVVLRDPHAVRRPAAGSPARRRC